MCVCECVCVWFVFKDLYWEEKEWNWVEILEWRFFSVIVVVMDERLWGIFYYYNRRKGRGLRVFFYYVGDYMYAVKKKRVIIVMGIFGAVCVS